MPSLNTSMNIIPSHLFCFIFSPPPGNKMLPAAASKLTTLSDGFQKTSTFFQEWLLCLSLPFWGTTNIGSACMALAVTTTGISLLEECLFLEPLIVAMVP